MKNPNRETVSKLEDLPNIGKDLRLIGIDHVVYNSKVNCKQIA